MLVDHALQLSTLWWVGYPCLLVKDKNMFSRTEPYKYDGNLQGLFNTIYWHLLEQGRPAVAVETSRWGVGEACSYRTADGLACAVGFLMTDEQARPEGFRLQGTVSSSEVIEVLNACGFQYGSDEFGLLGDFQSLHDAWALSKQKQAEVSFIDHIRNGVKVIAETYGLEVQEPPSKQEVTFKVFEKPKRTYGPHTKRYWAELFRKTAKAFESGAKHIAGLMGSPEQGYCAIGLMYDVAGEPGTGPWAFSDNMPCVVKQAFKDACYPDTPAGVISYNDYYLEYEETNVTKAGTQKLCKTLRRAAALLEHGGRPRSPKKELS
jgi:hypothetical protein